MKCPKCGYENPEGTLFCEECDWRQDMVYREKLGINSVYTSYIAVVLGIAALVLVIIKIGYGGLALGAVGMVLSGYSITAVRVSGVQGNVLNTLVALSAIGIVTSVIGFVYGFYLVLA